mgnify:CR=1 FL=1
MDYKDVEFLVNLHKKFEKIKGEPIPTDSSEFSLSDEEIIFLLESIEDTLFHENFNGVDYLKEKVAKMKQEANND